MKYVSGYVKVEVGQLQMKTQFEGFTSDIHQADGGWDIQGIFIPDGDIKKIVSCDCNTTETLNMKDIVEGQHLMSKKCRPIVKKKVEHPPEVVALKKKCLSTAKKWQKVFDEALKEARRYKRVVPGNIVTELDDTIKTLMDDVVFFHYANSLNELRVTCSKIESAYINAVWDVDNCKTAKQLQKEMFGK